MIVFPLVVALVAVTLVGLPLAEVLASIGLIGVVLGPIPAVTALGNRVLFGRGGLFAAFLVGAILWRLGIWLIPWIGAVLFVVGLTWGVGAWVMGALASRRAEPIPPMLLPPEILDSDESPQVWEPPKAPAPPSPEPEVRAAEDDAQEEDRPAVITADDVPQPAPDPTALRDESHHDEPVTFPGTTPGDEPGEAGDAPSESEHDAPEDDDPVARRFAELREEFRSKGDVDPPEPPSEDPPPGGDDWGLPQR